MLGGHGRALGGGLGLVVCAAAGAAAPAHATEIPTITLSTHGPDRDVPVDRSFYVAGEAGGDVQAAQAIVVRKGTRSLVGRVLWGAHGPSCTDLGKDLAIDKPARIPVGAGARRVTGVFPSAAEPVRGYDALVSAPWERDKDKDAKAFRVLVDHDPSFFRAGHTYCLFVIRRREEVERNEAFWPGEIKKLARAALACKAPADARDACVEKALKAYEAAIDKKLATLSEPDRARMAQDRKPLGEAARTLAEAALDFAFARDDACAIVTPWAGSLAAGATTATPYIRAAARAPWTDVVAAPLARAITTLLERSGELVLQTVKGGTAHYTRDLKVRVAVLSILDDRRRIRVAASTAPATSRPRSLEVTTAQLAVTDDVSVFDLIELTEGRLHVDSRAVAIATIETWLAELGEPGAPGADDRLANLARVADRLDALSGAIRIALAASAGQTCDARRSYLEGDQPPADGTRAAALRALGEWLRCEVLVPCEAPTAPWSDELACASPTPSDPWPGVTTPGEDPLAVLATKLRALREHHDTWQANHKRVALATLKETHEPSTPLPIRVSFTQKTWVFSYLTPVVGYAQFPLGQDTFSLFYTGVQLHLVPNPVDDVLWSNGFGRDVWRAFALEVAIAPSVASFGPDDRYRGPRGLPPVFVGAALHVFPYTSITVGGALIDRRRSTLPAEKAHLTFEPFVGLNVQANIPDLVRQLRTGGADTTVEK